VPVAAAPVSSYTYSSLDTSWHVRRKSHETPAATFASTDAVLPAQLVAGHCCVHAAPTLYAALPLWLPKKDAGVRAPAPPPGAQRSTQIESRRLNLADW